MNMSSAVQGVRKKKVTLSQVVILLVLTSFSILCIIPLLSIISASFSNDNNLTLVGFDLIPKPIDLTAYRYILNDPTLILGSYRISILITALGSIASLLITAGIAYVLSRPDFRFRNQLAFFVFFTMLFNGGLIPWYILISNYLQLINTIWALIVPMLVSAWNILLLRTFFQKIPFEIIESCNIDGANEFTVFFRIILPLSKPGLATIGLFIVLGYWNDWWLGLLFIEKQSLVPLQLLLYRMMSNITYLTTTTQIPSFLDVTRIPTQSARMVMAILAAGPMLFIFPFFQKYFVKGLTVGAVKG
jgi:putative aldouronate transport system permease protein